jgi:hypothetical protein
MAPARAQLRPPPSRRSHPLPALQPIALAAATPDLAWLFAEPEVCIGATILTRSARAAKERAAGTLYGQLDAAALNTAAQRIRGVGGPLIRGEGGGIRRTLG